MTARVILLVRHLMKKTYSFCVCLCSSQPSGFRPRPHSLQQSYRLLTLLARRYDILRFAPALIFLTVALCSEVIFVLSFTPASRYPCLRLLRFSVLTHGLALIFAAAIAVVNRSLFGSRTPRALAPEAPRAGQHAEARPGLGPGCLWRRRRGSWPRRYGGGHHCKPRGAVATGEAA